MMEKIKLIVPEETEEEINVRVTNLNVFPWDDYYFYVVLEFNKDSNDFYSHLKVPKKELADVLDSLFVVLNTTNNYYRPLRLFQASYARVKFDKFHNLRVIKHIVDDKWFNCTEYTLNEEEL